MMDYLDESSPECRTIGAVNTVTNEDGRLLGYNTDMDGFLEPIKRRQIGISGRKALVIGAGGAARAIICGFAKEKISKITIANRSLQKAKDAAGFAEGLGASSEAISLEEAGAVAGRFDFIVNASSVGLKNEPSPIPAENISKDNIVYDIVYMPMNTDFIQQSKKRSATIIYGYEMLLGQAALSFEIWHKRAAPHDAMKKALLGGF